MIVHNEDGIAYYESPDIFNRLSAVIDLTVIYMNEGYDPELAEELANMDIRIDDLLLKQGFSDEVTNMANDWDH